METSDLRGNIENKKHYGILVWNIITIITGFPAWLAIYFLIYPPRDSGDFSGLIGGMVTALIWLCFSSISTLIALVTFFIVITRKRKTIEKSMLIFTFACLAYGILSLLVIPISFFIPFLKELFLKGLMLIG